MAPGKNGYRVVMPVFDARERRLAPETRWPLLVGLAFTFAFSVGFWIMLYFCFFGRW